MVAQKPRIIVPDAAKLAKRQKKHDAIASRQYGRDLYFDQKIRALHIVLRSEAAVTIPIESISELAGATPSQLRAVRLTEIGDAIEQRELDVDISLPGLLRDVLGFELQQRRAALAKSPAKAEAARVNGAKGGRPPATLTGGSTYVRGFASSAGGPKKSVSRRSSKKSGPKKSGKRF